MDTNHLKMLIDACFSAKRLVETLPALPAGMKPRHIHVMDAIYELQAEGLPCRVSDVSSRLHTTMPSITLLIQELEALSMLEKYKNDADKRVIYLRLTSQGIACVKRHVLDFHREWADRLKDITNEDANKAVAVFEHLNRTMPGKEDKNYGKTE